MQVMSKKDTDYAILAQGIQKSYGDLHVLNGIDLKVKRGTILALLGPNGAGKTTMVKILSTLLKADGGEARIENYDIFAQADEVRGVIGLTGQYAAVDEYLTGRENLRMMGRLYHLSKADSARRTEELLTQFDLLGAADRQAKTYSGGMSRRLDLAASLIASPPVIFLDEPTTGLDPRSRLAMWDIIKSLVEQGSTILLTTQYLEEADQLADRIAVLDGGKIIAEGTSDQLKEKVGKERIELAFESIVQFEKGRAALADGDAQIDEKRRTISIANDSGVHKLKTLLEKLEKAEVSVESLSLHKPTLDDVFMHLTGHQAIVEEAEDAQNEAKTADTKKKKGKK
jgi:ABC-2 type transport system ATP-binding protein